MLNVFRNFVLFPMSSPDFRKIVVAGFAVMSIEIYEKINN